MPLIYQKTEAGQTAFKTRSAELSSRQRSAFLLFDGKRTLAEVLKATLGLGIGAPDIEDLVVKGLLVAPAGAATVPPPVVDTVPAAVEAEPASTAAHAPADELPPMQRYQRAYPVATRITAKLGLRGFKLNLAVEAASGYDDLVALLPKIAIAAGDKAAAELKRALGL
ncbi:hypothetical protein [Hydrogenophaga sp.]|uniref:hypothetical protein n=1 Tax=Hydrogenophaga sp. TaxID=1904254 RepID=UPI00286E9994|nr:hypothetical protein [Hydrogenophaga sp.]